MDDQLKREIAEELNVKDVVWAADLAGMVRSVARPNPSVLGPRFGKDFPNVMKALRSGEFTVNADGGVTVLGQTIEPEHVAVSVEAVEGFAAASEGGITVALDTNLDDALIAEGRARELVHRIQTMRKEAGFQVEDRIVTSYDAESALAPVMASFDQYIRQETLSEQLESNGASNGHQWSGAIDGVPITLAVRRVGAAA
jgi:isoleucyl-tRNA synthetase